MQEEKDKSLVRGLGYRLKSEREAREVTLEEISRVTKISIHLLHAIENDDWNALPGGIFTRNFIRLYANHLGLEAERWVDEYTQFIKVKNRAEGSVEEEDREERPTVDMPGSWIWALIIITIIIIVGGYFGISYFRSEAGEPVQQEVPEDVPAQTTEPVTNVGNGSVIEQQVPDWEGLTVELTDSGASCWFQWWSDGEMRSPDGGERLEMGIPRTFKADSQLGFNLAHTRGVEILVNGRAASWDEFSPSPRRNEEGTVISYVVQIELNEE